MRSSKITLKPEATSSTAQIFTPVVTRREWSESLYDRINSIYNGFLNDFSSEAYFPGDF